MAGVTIVLRSVADVYYATTTLISPGNVVQWFVRDDTSQIHFVGDNNSYTHTTVNIRVAAWCHGVTQDDIQGE